MVGSKLLHYEILEQLGSGGMGDVFLARDTVLDRRVALKVLSDEMASDPERLERFHREAKTVAALNHPNIVVLHSVEVVEGVHFLTMELVEGETLDEVIPRSGLEPKGCTRIFVPLADALAAAHELGIIHRDVKPANIMLTRDGRVKMLDFGLARFQPDAEVASGADDPTQALTRVGMTLGTVPYMSPEQARGDEIDHRSDIFSLGVVLYEAMAGRRPFEGDSSLELLTAILRDDPVSITELRADLPARLGRIIHTCLAKDRHLRYQSALELRDDLLELQRQLDSGSTELEVSSRSRSVVAAEPRGSIAVLPFTDMSRERDKDYFCEGMAEELINALGRIAALRVAARTSSFQFKGKVDDVRKIGEALGVATILEGAVRSAGDRVRITARLINVADGCNLWSGRFDRHVEDVFVIQEETAQAIVEKLQVKLESPTGELLVRQPTDDLDAYHDYLKGRFHWLRRLEGDLEKGLECFGSAIARDSAYALAHVGLADAYWSLVIYGYKGYEMIDAARAEAHTAVRLEPTLAEAHNSKAVIDFVFDWDFEAADKHFREALALKPSLSLASVWHTLLLGALGKRREMKESARRTLRIDPLSPYNFALISMAHYFCADYSAALEYCRKGLELDPLSYPCSLTLGFVLLERGEIEEGVQTMERVAELGGRSTISLGFLGHAYGVAGMTADAEAVRDEIAGGPLPEIVDESLAWVNRAMGEHERAQTHLKRVFDRHGSIFAFLFGTADPEYMERVGLPAMRAGASPSPH